MEHEKKTRSRQNISTFDPPCGYDLLPIGRGKGHVVSTTRRGNGNPGGTEARRVESKGGGWCVFLNR